VLLVVGVGVGVGVVVGGVCVVDSGVGTGDVF